MVGYDVMAALHSGVWPWDLPVPRPIKLIVEPFGVAATAARLLGLSREQTVLAMGHAGQAGMGIYEGSEHLWGVHPLVARGGVLAAMLARAGMPASPTIVEGKHGIYRSFFGQDVPGSVRENVAALGTTFQVSSARTTHRYPVSAFNAIPIDLLQDLIAEHALTPRRVVAVDLVLPEQRRSREAAYDTMGSRRGPTWLLTFVLADGRLDAARIEQSPGQDLLNLRNRIRVRFEGDRPFFYARVEVTTTDGGHHTAESSDRRPPEPLDRTEWLLENGREILPQNQLTRLAELIDDLDNVADVSEVMASIRPASSFPTS